MTLQLTEQDVTAAATRIRPYVRETMLEHSAAFSDIASATVWLKCENLQHTGSFKVRGALEKILSLTAAERDRGVVTASTGNHGRAVAHALTLVQARGTVYLPETVQATKVDALRRYPSVDLVFHGVDCSVAEGYARAVAEETDRVYISPYNDLMVIAGQGTIGVELLQQCPTIDVVLVPVGGGGLIAGIAMYLKMVKPSVRLIGCLPERSPVMSASIAAGHIVDLPLLPTLADATAGGIEPGAITFDLCQAFVDEYVLVHEAEIADAIRFMFAHHHMAVEGAAGVALAAYRKVASHYPGQTVAIVVSGGNIGSDTLRGIVCDGIT
jgi:threonine dehydratase